MLVGTGKGKAAESPPSERAEPMERAAQDEAAFEMHSARPSVRRGMAWELLPDR